MKVLVTGGAGYIGAHVVLNLLDHNHSVVVFDNFSTGQILNIDERSEIFNGDILSKTDLNELFKKYQFDAVMHFCALKAAGESMINPITYSKVNIIGTLNLLEMMLKNNVSNFIFSSSSSVYGEPKSKYLNEDHDLKPISYYGFTKLKIEEILDWYSKLKNLKFISLRYFNAAGYDLEERIKYPERNSANLIPKIMDVITGKQKVLEIFGSNFNTRDGTCVRDYIHVSDLASAHVKSLDYLKLSDSSLTLNLATGIGHTVLEIVRKVETLSSLKVNYKFVGKRNGDPSSIISRTKYKKFPLKWNPIYSDLETIIRSVFSLYGL